ncbi:Membrane protein [Gulosibacter sp. 10]|nr:Membrane protein [Gulosibacter sp. 10]
MLWVGMLAPGWVRERNARASQRHAVRLQQTMRAMAATSELPEVVTVEANARAVRARQQELRKSRQILTEVERAKARAEAERRRQEAILERERAEQELRESKLRAEAWRLASAAREAQLEDERKVAEELMTDVNARREAAARARAAAAAAEARAAEARGGAATAAGRWANGNSGSERAVIRRMTGEQPVVSEQRSRAAARRRRGRLTATSCASLGIIGVVAGFAGLGAGWGLLPLLLGLVVLGGSAWMLQRINRVWLVQLDTAEAPASRQEDSAPEAADGADSPAPRHHSLVIYDVEPEHVARTPEPENSWTPVPVPKPLYLERDEAGEPTPPEGPEDGPRVTDADIMELLREEARKSAQVLRDAHADVPSLPNRAVRDEAAAPAAQATSRQEPAAPAAERIQPITVESAGGWSDMGDLDALVQSYGEGELDNLDSVLRRRRAG